MKSILLITALIISISSISQEKAFGPINFGMTKNEVRNSVKGVEEIKMTLGTITTIILGDKYYGEFNYEEEKLCRIWLHHWKANYAAHNRLYTAYNATNLEADINKLISFLTEQYGEPIEKSGFIHPGEIEINRSAVAATWVSGEKIIMLYERNLNAIPYPQICILTKEYFNRVVKNQTEKEINDKEKSKSMF